MAYGDVWQSVGLDVIVMVVAVGKDWVQVLSLRCRERGVSLPEMEMGLVADFAFADAWRKLTR